jgi:hypothetical protein
LREESDVVVGGKPEEYRELEHCNGSFCIRLEEICSRLNDDGVVVAVVQFFALCCVVLTVFFF